MRLILQKGDADCGVAVIAMINGTSYEAAINLFPCGVGPKGISAADVMRATGRDIVRITRTRVADIGRLKFFRGAVLIKKRRDQIGHWVAWNGEAILCPENGIKGASYFDKYWIKAIIR